MTARAACTPISSKPVYGPQLSVMRTRPPVRVTGSHGKRVDSSKFSRTDEARYAREQQSLGGQSCVETVLSANLYEPNLSASSGGFQVVATIKRYYRGAEA